jgi:methionyl-tRNA formyltransferase
VRIIFAGTPDAAVPTLLALLASAHEVAAVLTRPPARSGRGRALRPSPVAEVARDRGIPVIEASTLREDGAAGSAARAAVRGARADLGVVVAYGALIPQEVLDIPPLGWINLHFSDLPRWRGAAPVQWALLAGDARTASSVFQLEAGLDTGAVLSRLPVAIGRETAGELLARMADLGSRQVVEAVDALEAGTARPAPQNIGDHGERITRARRLTHGDGFVDFSSPAEEVDRRIRAVTPNPGAWTTLPDGRRLTLGPVEPVPHSPTPARGAGRLVLSRQRVEVACARGAVRLGQVAPAGRGWMDAAAWARGARLEDGARLGAAPPQEPRPSSPDRAGSR